MALQAVILAAGYGTRIRDLTLEIPKALLPVANMPMIWYPIQLLVKAKFKEALVVVRESSKADIEKALKELITGVISLDYVTIPDDDECGTADTLRYISENIMNDLLLISCDLITDVSLHYVIDLYWRYDSTLTMLFASLPKPTISTIPGGSYNKNIEKDFIGFNEKGSRVLFVASDGDSEERLTFRKSVFKRHPYMEIRSDLLDAHLYIMKRSVLNCLMENKSISEVKGELVPYLVRKQFSKPKQSQEEDDSIRQAWEYSSWNDHHGDLEDSYHSQSCHAYIMESGFCIRGNTMTGYCEANRQAPGIFQEQLSLIKERCLRCHDLQPPFTSSVTPDCVIGKDTAIGDKVNIKRSAIGMKCQLVESNSVTDSVIMDEVIIEEGASLKGCIVFPKVTIGKKCLLKDCIIGTDYHVEPNSVSTSETLSEQNRMMEIE